MPRYFFHVHDGTSSPDLDGLDLCDVRTSQREAISFTSELMRHNLDEFLEGKDWRVDVADADGLTLFQVEVCVTDAPAIRPDPMTRR